MEAILPAQLLQQYVRKITPIHSKLCFAVLKDFNCRGKPDASTDSFKNVDGKGNEKNEEEGRMWLFLKRLGQEGFVDIRSKNDP